VDTRIKLKVLGLTYSQVQKGAYALVLAEENGPRRIPVVIGVSEAQSIAISLEGIVPPRPITHDLFVSFSHGFGIRLKEVCIYKFENGVFSSEMLFDDGTREIRIDARTSDAIAIALRTRSDIYVMQNIIDEAGFVITVSDTSSSASALYPIHAFIVEFLTRVKSVKVSIFKLVIFIFATYPNPQ
jgi:bifunctional DNase/RNase